MPPGLTADWALWGKEPHTNSGYKVLAACPPDRSADFNRDIHRWSPGTPAPGDRLPWITLGPCTAPDGTPTVGIFLLEGTDAVDRTNRPICRIDHFAVPAAEVSGLALSWCGLARAALDAVPQLAAAGAAPARLPVAPGGRLVTQVTAHVGPRVTEAVHWLAAAAGYLLDGTVVVTGGRMYDPLVLLDVLDCVAAMLPFGMRRTLSAATWVSSGSEVPMRLYWGVPDEAPGVVSLAWGGELPDVGGLSADARAYRDLLIEAWARHGGEAVLEHLADAREPMDIEGPDAHDEALRVLGGLDPALAVEQEVRAGREVGNDRIDAALLHPLADPRSVTVLSGQKLAGRSVDMAPLARHLKHQEVSEAFRGRLVDDLLSDEPARARDRFETARAATSGTKEDLDPLDQVLAFVIDEVRGRTGTEAPDPVVEQLLPHVAPFPVGTMAFTQSLLLVTPGLAGRLVHALCAGPDPAADVLAWLRWLGDGSAPRAAGSAELAPLYELLDSGHGAPSRKWTTAHPEAAVRLLGAAAACGRAEYVLQGEFFQGLINCAFLKTPSDPLDTPPSMLLERVLEGRPHGVRPETAARWDVLCALTGLPPLALFTLAEAPERPGSAGLPTRLDGYISTLCSELDCHPVRTHATLVVQMLLEGVLNVDPETGEGPDRAGRELTVRLLERHGPHVQVVADAVRRLTEEPRWHETEHDERWLQRIAGQLPQLGAALALRAVHRAARAAGDGPQDLDELASHLYAARRAGADGDSLCVPLRSWAARERTGHRVLSVLTAYRRTWEAYTGADRARQERLDLELALARGRDSGVWQQYRDHAIRQLTAERTGFEQGIRELRHKQQMAEQEIARLRSLGAGSFPARS
ncbi:hypothetical protein [Streptomyces sp. NPDC096153]|uniref:hypothetical protein n=1 Tax=unclassified Streptomyces TaxID=2593676 RepID=UPI00332C4918